MFIEYSFLYNFTHIHLSKDLPEALRAAIDAANDAANDYTSKVVQGRSRNVKEVFEVEKQREFKNVENASSSNVIGASKGKYI